MKKNGLKFVMAIGVIAGSTQINAGWLTMFASPVIGGCVGAIAGARIAREPGLVWGYETGLFTGTMLGALIERVRLGKSTPEQVAHLESRNLKIACLVGALSQSLPALMIDSDGSSVAVAAGIGVVGATIAAEIGHSIGDNEVNSRN